MGSLQDVRRDVGIALLAGAALLACGAADAAPPQVRCQQDALENWYCAADEKGVAVLDKLGVPVETFGDSTGKLEYLSGI